MNIGAIDDSAEARVRLAVSSSGGTPPREIDAILDTGFEGALALPPASIAALDLRQTGQEQYATASGETYQTGTYRATVVLGERRIVVDEVIEAAEPLVRADLLWGFRVCVDYREDGRVTLEAL
jgi:predicted aspartyl protease